MRGRGEDLTQVRREASALAEFAMATPATIIAAPASATGVGTSPTIG